MSPYNRNQKIDPHLVKALNKLPKIMKNNENKEVRIRPNARNESGEEHISAVRHGLQVRDIELIPSILQKPYYYCRDPKNKNYKNYYGKREGKHDSSVRNKGLLLKIVTSIQLDGNEEIITIYPSNSIKNLKSK